MRETLSQKFQTAQGEVEITLSQIGGIPAGMLIVRLAKQHGAAVGKLMAMFSGGADAVGDAIATFASNLDEREFELLLLQLTKGGRANLGEEFEDLDQKVLNRLFRGHTGELFKLLWFGMVINYENFPAEFAALLPKKMAGTPLKPVSASDSKG